MRASHARTASGADAVVAPAGQLRVRVVPYQPHSLAFGGFDLQMLSAMAAVRDRGVVVEPLDPWSRDGDFHAIHLWGLGPVHLPTATWAKRAGKAVVMTALLGFPSRGWAPLRRLRARFGPQALDRQLAAMLDALVVPNEQNAEVAERVLGVDPAVISVIPNIVDDAFLDRRVSAHVDFGVRDFALCTGNISPRKNQLALARAAAAAGVPLLLIGDLLPGEEQYGDQLARVVREHAGLRWHPGVAQNAAELQSAYAQCALFALPSFDETQPISALEAVAMGRPLLLADRPYATQRYFEAARLVNPDDLADIARGLRDLRDNARAPEPALSLEECRRERVGERYDRVYRSAVARRHAAS